MKNFGNKGQQSGASAGYPYVQQLDVLAATLRSRTNMISSVKPIPIPYEDDADWTHDGVRPCGNPDCPCATYGYGVSSLHDPRLP